MGLARRADYQNITFYHYGLIIELFQYEICDFGARQTRHKKWRKVAVYDMEKL
jgi:hypothetical protein